MDEPVENEYWEPSDEAESAVGPGQRPDNSEVPAAIDPSELVTYSGTPDVEYESSPDVAPDGSIGSEETRPLGEGHAGPGDRRRGFSAFLIIVGVLFLCLVLLLILLVL